MGRYLRTRLLFELQKVMLVPHNDDYGDEWNWSAWAEVKYPEFIQDILRENCHVMFAKKGSR